MKKHHLLLPALCLAVICKAQTIAVTMPDVTNQNIGTQFNVAVQTATNILTGSNIKSYQFSIALPANCSFVSIVHQSGDLGFSWGTPTYNVSGGTLTIASAGTTNITGPGTFFRIRLQPLSAGTSPITFTPASQCMFNQGTGTRTLTDGSVQVNVPPMVNVSPGSALLVRTETVVCSASGGTGPYTYATTVPTVGSMSGSTFTALAQGLTQVRATDAGGYQGTSGSYDVRTYQVTVGSDQGNAQHAFSVPITIGNPATVGFTSGEFQISFDNSVFDFTSITTAGYSMAGTTITSNVVGNNLYFSFGGSATINPANGATLCKLNFVKDPLHMGGGATALGIVSALFNETLNARTTDGSLILDAPSGIGISPAVYTMKAGAQQQFTVSGTGTPPYTWGVTNGSVAGINSSGLFSALNNGTTQVTVSDAAGNSAVSNVIGVYDADLTIASVSVQAGTVVHVPVVLGPSVNNEPVLSAQLHISYDASALSFIGLEQTATLSQGWSNSYSTPAGQLILSLAGTTPVTPGGVLVFLKFQTQAPLTPGSSTALSWTSSLINEGDPSVQTAGGTVTATNNTCGTTGCMNPYACNYDSNALCDNGTCIFNPALCAVKVSPKVFLEGPYVQAAGTMTDGLRAAGLVPLTEPYTSGGYTHSGGGGGETTTAGVLATTGNNAIVDWVVVELRSAAASSTVVATRSALVQRDGDVVATDGINPVSIAVAAGNYFVAVRHRNHLGAMRSTAVALSATPTAIDFTSAATATYGTTATKTVGTVQVFWCGDVNFNHAIKYTGSGNDRDPILVKVGSSTPNNAVSGYWREDVNLSGQVKYTGSGNDRDPILVNVGSTTPNNVRVEQLP